MKENNTDARLKRQQTIVAIVLTVLAAAVIILCALHLCHTIPYGLTVALPLMGLICLLQAWLNHKTDKGVAIFSAVAGIFIIVCTIIRLF